MSTTVIGYIRVSTGRQASRGVSLAAQRDKIARWAELYGASVQRVYSDPGRSGRSLKRRPGLAAAIAAAKENQATLVVYSLDRLARNTEDAIQLCRSLIESGGALAAVAEHLDTNSAFGRWAFRALASNAELESDRLGERVRLALDHKRRQRSRWWGGRNAPYGWRLAADGSHVVQDRAEQAAIRKMRRWRRDGHGYGEIAKRLRQNDIRTKTGKKVWQKNTVRKILLIDARMQSSKRLG